MSKKKKKDLIEMLYEVLEPPKKPVRKASRWYDEKGKKRLVTITPPIK